MKAKTQGSSVKRMPGQERIIEKKRCALYDQRDRRKFRAHRKQTRAIRDKDGLNNWADDIRGKKRPFDSREN